MPPLTLFLNSLFSLHLHITHDCPTLALWSNMLKQLQMKQIVELHALIITHIILQDKEDAQQDFLSVL